MIGIAGVSLLIAPFGWFGVQWGLWFYFGFAWLLMTLVVLTCSIFLAYVVIGFIGLSIRFLGGLNKQPSKGEP